jgi:hypothetical protein
MSIIRWCKILRPKYIKSVNLVTIDNLSEYDYQENKGLFKKFENLFLDQVIVFLVFI